MSWITSCTSGTEPGTLRLIWRAPGHGWALAPSYDSTTVYFGGFNHDLVAVDKSTGTIRWRQTTQAAAPYTVGNNTVVSGNHVALADIDVYVYDRHTGAPKFVYAPSLNDNTGQGYLAANDSIIYATSLRGKVFAFRSATGTDQWVATVGDSVTSTYHPVLSDGVLLVGTKRFANPATGALVALDAVTGTERWRVDFLPAVQGQYSGCFGGVAVAGNRVFVGTEDGRVYAFDKSTGDTLWIAARVHSLPPDGPWGDKRPVATNGNVVIVGSSQGIVVGLDAASGAELWRNTSIYNSATDPIVADERFGFVNFGSTLAVFDMANGRIVWRSRGLWPLPSLDGTRLFVSGTDGFYAFRTR